MATVHVHSCPCVCEPRAPGRTWRGDFHVAQVNSTVEWVASQLQQANSTVQSSLLPELGDVIQLAGQAEAPAVVDVAVSAGTAATAYPTLETWLTTASDALSGLGSLLAVSRR